MGQGLIGLIIPLLIVAGLLWVVFSVGTTVAIFLGIFLVILWLLTK